MRGLINIQNNNNKCFRWCLVRCFSTLNKNPANIRNDDREFAKQLNFKVVKFPVHIKDYAKICRFWKITAVILFLNLDIKVSC